jgi:membrane-associated phospholipid phosphatase
VLLVLAWSRRRARYLAIVPGVVVVLDVALSRLLRGVHYPTDVLAGIAYGLVWLALCQAWLRPTPGPRGDAERHRAGQTAGEPLGDSR